MKGRITLSLIVLVVLLLLAMETALAEEESQVESINDKLLNTLKDVLNKNTVFGDPIIIDEQTKVIPMATANLFAEGTKIGEGIFSIETSRGMGNIAPASVIVIVGEDIKEVPIRGGITVIIDALNELLETTEDILLIMVKYASPELRREPMELPEDIPIEKIPPMD